MSGFTDPVRPHGPLIRLAPRLWRVTGQMTTPPMPRSMVVWSGPDGLWLHSVVALDAPGMAALDALGPVRWIVVPSRYHRLDAPAYAERYPEASVVCPRSITAAVAAKVRVDGACEDALPALGITVHRPGGLRDTELVYEVDSGEGRALVFNDQVFHLDHVAGPQGWMMRYVTRSTGFFGISGLGRLLLLQSRPAFRAWLSEQAARGDVTLISMSHGAPVVGAAACADRLREAADRV